MSNLEASRIEQFKQFTETKLRGVRCPEHHQPPAVSFHGERLAEITISLRGCCPQLMKLANAAVGKVLPRSART
jgi:hypothetical protein